MPSNSDSLGHLEISSLSVVTLNDRLRRISIAIAGAGGVGAVAAGGSISQIVLSVPGTLGVAQNVAPVLTLGNSFQPTTALAYVKRAPIGSALTMQLYVGGSTYGNAVTIPVGSLSASVDFSGVQAISTGQIIRLDITAVGALLTGVSFPGSDLTFILR